MVIYLFHGQGEVRDNDDGNVNTIFVSIELLPGLRTWHQGKPLLGEVVPVILGKELPSEQYQFVIRQSSIKIPAISYSFYGEKGYIYAEKIDGDPLIFQEWAATEIPLAGGNPKGVYSHDPPTFQYRDFQPWDCYDNLTADCPEYGQLAPVLDLSTNGLDFLIDIPPVYANGAKLDLKVQLQTLYSAT